MRTLNMVNMVNIEMFREVIDFYSQLKMITVFDKNFQMLTNITCSEKRKHFAFYDSRTILHALQTFINTNFIL